MNAETQHHLDPGRLRPLTCALALALCSLAALTMAPSTASAGSQTEPRSLGAVNVLSAREPAYVEIVVEKKERLGNPWISGIEPPFTIRGQGGFVGFALIRTTADAGEDPQGYLGGRLPASAGGTFLVELGGIPDGLDHRTVTIQPGHYRLYVLPGRSKARITLRLPNHQGRLRLEPRATAEYVSKALQPYHAAGPTNLYSAGGSAELPGDGLLFQAAWFPNDGHVLTDHSACFWRGEPRLPLAQTTNCGDVEVYEPSGIQRSKRTIDRRASLGSNVRLYYGDTWVEASHRRLWGQSLNLETVALAEEVHTLALWIDLGR